MSHHNHLAEEKGGQEAWRMIALCGLVAALGLGGFLSASALTTGLGFPLDDAWIHQTYARNLGIRGEFAFQLGEPSAGSTSPIWAALLAIGYALRLEPLLWAYFVGWVVLAALAYTGYHGVKVLAPTRAAWAPLGAILLGLEWHMVWAAGSGMETLLAALLVMVVLLQLAKVRTNWWILGTLIGLGTWIRPDLITLLGPAVLTIFLVNQAGSVRARQALKTVIGFGAFFLPYLLFNHLLTGTIWPNTFYAKQAEYEILQQVPLLSRYISQLRLPLIGVGIVLLPGLVYFVIQGWTNKSWGPLTAVLWSFLYLAVYALRLPVTYQHGRYVMPAMPVFFLFGWVGLILTLRHPENVVWRRIIGRTWLAVAGTVLISFLVIGARGYANDVGFIETEMVATANWVADHTKPGALIAAHDIGALGYIAGRDLVDMAGLVSPEVIPFIRDEDRLEQYITEKGVRYLVTFPSWYPDLVRGLEPIFQTQGRYGPLMENENMAVFSWPPSSP